MRIVAALLLVAALVGLVLWQGMQPQRAMQAMPAWQSPQLARVDTIKIAGPGMAKVVLTHQSSGWRLNGKTAADGKAVQHLLDDLQRMRPVRMVTAGHTHDAELDLGARAVVVTLAAKDGQRIDAFEIGKQGPDLITTYVRRVGQPAVMAMDRALLWQVKRLPEAWQAPKSPTPKAKPPASVSPHAVAP